MNDILRLLREDEIHTMIDRFAQDIPNSVLGYNFLRMYLKWQQIIANPAASNIINQLDSDTVWRNVYTKRDGVAENCTIVSISGDRDLNIFMFSYDTAELCECIEHTKLINWARGPAFTGFDGNHHQKIVNIVHEKGLTLQYIIPSDGYYLPREAALKFHVNLPDDVRIDSIHKKDYDIVNRSWTYCYPESNTYMKCLMLLNDNIAVYTKDTNEIKSWAIVDELFSIAMLNTKPDYKRKGYASMVVKSLAQCLAEKYEMGTFCFITQGNSNSELCFAKLGFQKLDLPQHLIWIKVIPTQM